MILGLEHLIENVGISFENIILIIVLVGNLLFMAKDYKLGITMYFITSGCLFMWFYAADYNYAPSLIVFFISLIILALSLYTVNKSASSGGIT